MRKQSLVLILVASAVSASAALGIAACSSDPTYVVVPGVDAATNNKDVNQGQPDTSVVMNNDSGPTADGGCKSPPGLFKPTDAGMYCPFSANGDAGSAHCTVGSEVCCLSPSSDAGSSVCESNAASCPNSFEVWACSAPQECTGVGQVCCLTAGPLEADNACSGHQKTKGFSNTRCTTAAECTGMVDAGKFTDTQFTVCEQQSDCTTGTCTAVKTTGTSIGLCL